MFSPDELDVGGYTASARSRGTAGPVVEREGRESYKTFTLL